MITQILINIFLGLISFIINLLPNMSSLPESFENAWNFLGNFIVSLASINDLISNLLIILGWFIIFEVALFTFESVNWIYNKIRGSG